MPIMNTVIAGGGTTPTGSISITSNGTHDVTNYASADVNVPVGAMPNYVVWRIVVNGTLSCSRGATGQTVFSTSPATDVSKYGCAAIFYNAAGGMGNIAVDCSSLTSVSGQYAFDRAFEGNYQITSFDFSNIKTITGQSAFARAWAGYKSNWVVNTISFPALETIGGFAFQSCLSGDNRIQTFNLPSLKQINNYGLNSAFESSSALTTVVLGNTEHITLGTGAFNYMFSGCSTNIDVYAPAANQAEIEAMSDYPAFGGYGTVTWHWQS